MRVARVLFAVVACACGGSLASDPVDSGATCDACGAGPQTLATDLGATELSVDENNVYWTNMNTGTLRSVPVSGGAPSVLAVGDAGVYTPIALGDDVFWTAQTGIQRTPLDGGSTTTLFVGAELQKLAVNHERVYSVTGTDEIVSIPTAGGAPSVLASNQLDVALAADDSRLFWGVSPSMPTTDASIMQEPADGGVITTIASGQQAIFALRLVGQTLYFEYGSGGIARMDVSGGAVTTLVEPNNGVFPFAADGENVYFAPYNAGTVMKVSSAGGVPTTLATGQTFVRSIAVNSTSVFWIEADTGKIMKLTPK